MSRFSRLLVLAALLFSSVASPISAQQLTAKCSGTTQTITSAPSVVGAPFNVPFAAGANLVLTEPNAASNAATNGHDVVTLQVQIAPKCTTTAAGKANIQLAFYQLTSAGFTLLAQTKSIPLTPDDTLKGTLISAGVLIPDGGLVSFGGSYAVGFITDNPSVCLETEANQQLQYSDPYPYSAITGFPVTFTPKTGQTNPDFEAGVTVCITGNVVTDPVFTGFNGQQFIVKGEAGQVFNLISSPTMTFNNRFIKLDSEAESMTAESMKQVRAQFKQSKMIDLVKATTSRPPVTAAWNHPGTYMGESGITLGESKLYVAAGPYATGFSSITLDGVALPVSAKAVELDGDMTVTHSSAFKVTVSTPTVRFTIVNADNFINIEHAKVQSADAQLTGLLGQTADAEWEVVQSAEFKDHLENDYRVASNELF